MHQTYSGIFKDFLLQTSDLAGLAWNDSPDKRLYELYKEQAERSLLKLIPPKKRKKAFGLLEDLDSCHVFKINFYYTYGVKDGGRILRLLNVL